MRSKNQILGWIAAAVILVVVAVIGTIAMQGHSAQSEQSVPASAAH